MYYLSPDEEDLSVVKIPNWKKISQSEVTDSLQRSVRIVGKEKSSTSVARTAELLPYLALGLFSVKVYCFHDSAGETPK